MMHFHPIKLELLRPGPTHNQLLSPLTPYLALCGNSSPITFQIKHEHYRFLSQLERLRYVIAQQQDLLAIPDRVREATVGELGNDVAEILAGIPSLLAETITARGEVTRNEPTGNSQFVHLSLVLGGAELALIPFEMTFSPQAYPGEGLEFCLQLTMPVVPTRQTRRVQPAFATWNVEQEPKLLIVSAAPGGLDVPLAEHLQALRFALEPWIRWPKNADLTVSEEQRLPLVKERIKLITNATVEDIYSACACEQFTHVHVLAHGGAYEFAGERQFGVVLCSERDRTIPDIVSGKRLAKALHARASDGSRRSNPFIVTLATCDSGNPGSVLVPGGSIAHELHNEGIPWVFASQFPLTKLGSVLMAEEIYPRLLRGDDPRVVLHELRRKLFLSTQRNHDWASVIAYATVPQNFEESIAKFFELQSRRAIDIGFARADDLASIESNAATEEEINATLNRIKEILDVWHLRLPKPNESGDADRWRRAECYGMHGSVFKRIALLYYKRKNNEKGEANLKNALGHYRKAMEELASGSRYHWVATQVLSLAAVLGDPPDPDTFFVTLHFAHRNILDASVSEQAWAHGTLAELEMLSLYHQKLGESAKTKLAKTVREHCRKIVDLMGVESFHVESTRRQFQRYIDYWKGPWKEIAEAAVHELKPPGVKTWRD